MKTIRYIALSLILFGCFDDTRQSKNIGRYFIFLDSIENNRPSWLTNHLFIYINDHKTDSTTDSNYLWVDYYAFFKDNTYDHGTYVRQNSSNPNPNSPIEISCILDSIKNFQIKSRKFFEQVDYIFQEVEIGGIYVVQNDTIKIKPIQGNYYRSYPHIDYRMRSSVFAINHQERSLEQVKFGIYPKTVAQNIAWGQNPEHRKFKGYPVTFLDSLPPLPLSQWPPFRRWKARLDSINAGLRPPEKSR